MFSVFKQANIYIMKSIFNTDTCVHGTQAKPKRAQIVMSL